MSKNCESCLMPLSKDPGESGSDKYCSFCYQNGEFLYKGNDVREFQRLSYEGMRAGGMNPIMARIFAFMIRFAPRWQKAK